jgi:hypothetical protein
LHCSLLVLLLRFFQALYLTTIMGHKAKKKSKNNTKTENYPQEVANDKTTEQYVFRYKAYPNLWHKSVQVLLPGQIIDIPYLKQLATCVVVPIAYCKKATLAYSTIPPQDHLASLGIDG